MKRITINMLLAAVALLVAVSSCRQDNDELVYVNGAGLGELDATTYVQKWDVMWKAYNQNYVGWDMETVDWDAQYAKYRPLFAQLDAQVDSLNKLETPNEDSLKAITQAAHKLYVEAFDTLHDGHTAVVYFDYAQPKVKGFFTPGDDRRKKYEDFNDTVSRFEKHYYKNVTKDIVKYTYLSPGYMLMHILSEKYIPAMLATSMSEKVDTATQHLIQNFCAAVSSKIAAGTYNDPEDYDDFLDYYQELMDNKDFASLAYSFGCSIDDDFAKIGSGVETFVTKDGIAGYRLKAFDLPRMGSNYANDITGDVAKYIHDKLFEWRDTVYDMHDNGTLKGVILDVRHNGGGALANLGYFSGLLFKGSRYPMGTIRQKNGIGRLDYTAPREKSFDLPAENDEDITEPIVILTDAQSVSCAEVSTIAVKQHTNGVSIGTRTFGAGCMLVNDYRVNSAFGYSGCVGVMGVTPVFAYIPNCLASYYKFGVIEGRGVSPDIEVRFDKNLYQQTGRDNQFERALEYIRNGK